MRTKSRGLHASYLLGADLVVVGGFSIVICALVLFSPSKVSVWHASIVLPLIVLSLLLAVVAVQFVLARERSLRLLGRRALTLVRDWAPLLIAVTAYENIHDLTYVIRPQTVDGVLRLLDERIFGITPALAFDRIACPALSALFSAAYALYFFYPTLLLVLLYRRGEMVLFRELGLALGLCLYLGLLGYVLVPAVGPRYVMIAEFHRTLLGPWLTAPAAQTWNLLEKVERDCFPSLHTALSALSLVYFVRLRRALPYGHAMLAVFAPLIVLLWLSTLYLRYHWGVDVLAGGALALLANALAPRLHRAYQFTRM